MAYYIGQAVGLLATIFRQDEQKTRVLILLNALCFFVFCAAVGSTSMFAELLSMVTTVITMMKYRKQKQD